VVAGSGLRVPVGGVEGAAVGAAGGSVQTAVNADKLLHKQFKVELRSADRALKAGAWLVYNEMNKENPPGACQLFGGSWSLWTGWHCADVP
jgi:hypothetical protein